MRKNIIFSVFGVVMAIFAGDAYAAKQTVSMGTFAIPLPSNGIDGKDGCSPEVTVTEKDAQTGCYTTTIQKKKLENGSCENDGSAIERTTCDGAKGDDGNNGCYEFYDVSGWGTEDFDLSIKWCCGGNDNCQEMTDSYPSAGSYTSYSSTWIAQNCSSTFDTTPIANGYTVIVKNPCYGTETSYDITGEVGESVNITSVTAVYTPYPQSTGNASNPAGGANPDKQGFMELTITYNDNTSSKHITPDPCEVHTKQYSSGEHQGEYYQVKACYDAQGASFQDYSPQYSKGEAYEFKYATPSGTFSLADVANKTIPKSIVNDQYKGPDMTNLIPGYKYDKYVFQNPNGGDDIIEERNKVFDTADEVIEYNNGQTNLGKRYTCGGTTTSAPCWSTNNTRYYCFGDVTNCGSASPVGEVLDNYLLKDEQVQVDIIFVGNKLYYCKAVGCQDHRPDEVPEDVDWPNYWTELEVDALQGAPGDSCAFVKSYSNPTVIEGASYYWYKCCGTAFATCTPVTDTDLINKLEDSVCQVNYTHKYLHDNNGGDPIANDTKAGAIGERIIVTNTCNSDAENLDSIYGTDGQNGQNGQNGNDYDPCDGLEAGSQDALSRVHHTTGVYISHGNGNNGTTTGIGYYQETNVMCDINGNKIVKKYDECEPVSIAPGVPRTVAGVTCSGNQTLLLCTPQQGNDSTQYPVCSDAEVADYPKAKYFEPTISNGQITAEGYTQKVHKYTANGSEVTLESDVKNPDECHTVYKVISRTANNNTVTATTQTTKKCKVQSYSHPVPSSAWTVDTWYCLNTDANGSCEEYRDSIVDSETSTLKYHLPTMDANDSTKPVSAGYTYYEVTDENDVIVREIVRDKEDKCDNKILGRNANNSSSVTVSQCTVGAPTGTPGLTTSYTSGTTYCLNYANGTCPSGLTDIGAAIDSAADAENDPCAGVANSSNEVKAKTVKKLKTREYTRATGSQGALEAVYEMCNGSDHSEATPDECKELPKPTSGTGSDCAGAWMQCGDQTLPDTNSNKIYYYCDTEADSIFNAINTAETAATAAQNAATENDPCADLNATTAAKTVKKTEYEYVAKGATGNTTGVGYVKKTKVMCDDTQTAPHKEEELMYDTCLPAAADANCSGTSARNYKCYNQTLSLSDSSREYPSCNPTSTVGTIITANAINDKLNKDVTFSTGTHNNEQYILMSAGDGTTKPVVAVDTLKPQSLFDIWKEQYKDLTPTKCAALFGSTKTDCENDLDETDMLNNISAYGVWKTDQVITQDITDNAKLNMTAYQNSLKPCQSFRIEENDQYQGGDGKQYVMTCVE